MALAIIYGHTVKPFHLHDDKRGIPVLSFSVQDQDDGRNYYPLFADGNVAKAIDSKVQKGEPVHWVCDITSEPDTRLHGVSSRVAFRVIAFERG